ncbi:glycosyltransferase [Mycobacterium sp.]|uniref:glycosyltransferase n=1 Tax=Mycobacterium sp. TaxID=1785 RepID=UPI0025E727D2|nr:glycosyltransferase [Mycobacterium sp.]
MPEPVIARPAICLNMIVRNEAHIVHEVLDSVAPYITSWVIVDTGSDDGTQDAIRSHMSRLGIRGELHERPWRNFGHNRTEALVLAQGHGDYIWVIDADDIVIGTPDFADLSADIYSMRIGRAEFTYWRPQLFRDGARVRYEGVVHEGIAGEPGQVQALLPGEYYIESRRLGSRSQDARKYARDRDLLLAEVERNPEDTRSVFYLAQSYYDLGDFVNARKWYARRAEMDGWDQEIYYSKWRVAESMAQLVEPWPDVQDAYLRAWEYRPTRAEPLHLLARRYRLERRFELGYLFAQRATQIPLPGEDNLFVSADVYTWRAADEQAICASWIGKHAEAFDLCRQLVARPGVPDDDRRRVAGNRDFSVPSLVESALAYPEAVVRRLIPNSDNADAVVSLLAGPDQGTTEQTLNTFLHCCLDAWRIKRVLILDAGLTAQDRATLQSRYPLVDFIPDVPGDSPDAQLARLRNSVDGRLWLHLGFGWQFFAAENYITRLAAVLDAETRVFQAGINFTDAAQLTGTCAEEATVRRTPEAGRYVLTDSAAVGPAMFDTTRMDSRGVANQHSMTATLDEVLCIHSGAAPPQPTVNQPDVAGRLTVRSSTRFAVAVVSPPDYQHSEVFREIAEGFHYALSTLGYDSVLTNRLDMDDRRTIVLGPNLLATFDIAPPQNPILFNLEQVYFESAESVWMTPKLLDLFRRFPVWDYSQSNIDRLTALDVPDITHVPIGYVPELTRISPGHEDIDVLFYGSNSDPRRRAVLDGLRSRGLDVKELFGVYGAERDAWIARSKVVINIHLSYYKAQVFEIARVSYLLANRRVVVSERGSDSAETRDLEAGIAFAEYDELVDRCVQLCGDESARRELGERGYKAFSARSQVDIFRRVLASDRT